MTAAWMAWQMGAQTRGTIVLASTGHFPVLSHIRCHREDRRQLFLIRRLRESEHRFSMANIMIKIAMKMASEGAVPGLGKHGKTHEFIQRCADAVKAADPNIKTDIPALSPEEQYAIRVVLGGGTEPYTGCLNEECLSKNPEWLEADLSMPAHPRLRHLGGYTATLSRCSRCSIPKSYGRTWDETSTALRARSEPYPGLPRVGAKFFDSFPRMGKIP